jgi:hypothetical protein
LGWHFVCTGPCCQKHLQLLLCSAWYRTWDICLCPLRVYQSRMASNLFFVLTVFRAPGSHSQMLHTEGGHFRPGGIQWVAHCFMEIKGIVYVLEWCCLGYGTADKQTNSVAFSPQANYTDWATATCWRNLVPTFVDGGVSRGQHSGFPMVVNLCFLDWSHYFSFK